jgi:hypothetical protein
MPDDADDKLTPARAEDLRACIAYALTSDSRLAHAQSAELMASIVAERLIARLDRAAMRLSRNEHCAVDKYALRFSLARSTSANLIETPLYRLKASGDQGFELGVGGKGRL